MDRDLVYDVGMHNGDDTAFYVSQGYRVVAIEADPAQAEAQRKRFVAEIEKGQVHVVEAAIGPSHGQASFGSVAIPSSTRSIGKMRRCATTLLMRSRSLADR
ncbi:hypothetical protein [Mesorhizobium sp.]|uniref:hypothetical protein n=1 Tax=Mesorhizobium sp. TaxID=1871066 RepID=UPI000FE98E8A|nr:hypothetical protein [Mesorhizobium sp.]RWM75657.1 MAG: hypothetical protein EOR82_03195 [Mesorhizobium sp.]TJV58759.1 MAG: hypothetical protein E5X82_17120 [Mesorhizobium sp.]